jgi:hypothetical protein
MLAMWDATAETGTKSRSQLDDGGRVSLMGGMALVAFKSVNGGGNRRSGYYSLGYPSVAISKVEQGERSA